MSIDAASGIENASGRFDGDHFESVTKRHVAAFHTSCAQGGISTP